MRILFFGDSIAQGFYDSQGGWVQRIANECHQVSLKQTLAGKQGYIEVYNLGISGDTVAGITARMQSEVEARRLYDDPDIIVLAIGMNDAILRANLAQVEEYDFQGEVETLVKKAKELTGSVLCIGLSAVDESMTDPWPYSSTKKQWKNNRINLFEDTIKQAAIQYDVPFVPVHDQFLKGLQAGHNLLSDGLHPNDAGHKLIHDIVKPQLARLIASV